jgi:hypothetical protein
MINRPDVEPGRISRATFTDLPERFQVAARELARRGEIVIEGTPVRVAESRDHDGRPGLS